MYFLHLKFTVAGENADPFAVVVSNNDVTVGVDGDAGGPLELPRSPSPYPESTLKLSFIREYLYRQVKCLQCTFYRLNIFRNSRDLTFT